jgi:uncharacterized protein (TIGR03435 family)
MRGNHLPLPGVVTDMMRIATRAPRRLTASLSLLISVVASAPLRAQSTSAATASRAGEQAPLRFEVVSIHLHPFNGSDEPSDRRMLPGGRFVAAATTVSTLLRIAFGTDSNRISGAPHWVGEEMFDIDGVTEGHSEVRSPEQFQQLIRSLLEDRFQLKFRREQRDASVYWLEADKPGKLGPVLSRSREDSQPNMSVNSSGPTKTMKMTKESMKDIAAALTRQIGRPVEDHTALEGTFDFQIAWSPDDLPNAGEPPLLTVLKDRLGLRLRSARGTTEQVVLEQISRPTPN